VLLQKKKPAALWRESFFCSVCVLKEINKSPRRCDGNLILSSVFLKMAFEILNKNSLEKDLKNVFLSLNKKVTSQPFFSGCPRAFGFLWLLCYKARGQKPAPLWREANFGPGFWAFAGEELKGN
jgi:hypothetical protein